MKAAAQAFDAECEQQRDLSRKILEAKIHLRICQLEVLAAQTWLDLVRRQWPPASRG
jgi:hypothetical protein